MAKSGGMTSVVLASLLLSGSCNDPPHLIYASLKRPYRDQNYFPVGSTVEYECRLGYKRDQGRPTITCLESLEWSQPEQFCTSEYDLYRPEFGRKNIIPSLMQERGSVCYYWEWFLFKALHLFIWKVRVSKRGRDQERDFPDIFCPLVHSVDHCDAWAGHSCSQESETAPWPSTWLGETRSIWAVICCFPECAVAGSWDGNKAGLNPRHTSQASGWCAMPQHCPQKDS